MKVKSLEEVTYILDTTIKKIQRSLHIVIGIAITVSILALIVCFNSMKLAIDYEALKKEKENLEQVTETQSSMISDLEENCKDLYIEIENLSLGGNVE